MESVKKKWLIGVLVALVFVGVAAYLIAIAVLNERTSKKIAFNPEMNCRWEADGDFYYTADTASVFLPKVEIYATYNAPDDIEVEILIEKSLFGKKKMYLSIYDAEEDKWSGRATLNSNMEYTHMNPKDEDVCTTQTRLR